MAEKLVLKSSEKNAGDIFSADDWNFGMRNGLYIEAGHGTASGDGSNTEYIIDLCSLDLSNELNDFQYLVHAFFRYKYRIENAGTGTSYTVDVYYEGSKDGSSWVTLHSDTGLSLGASSSLSGSGTEKQGNIVELMQNVVDTYWDYLNGGTDGRVKKIYTRMRIVFDTAPDSDVSMEAWDGVVFGIAGKW